MFVPGFHKDLHILSLRNNPFSYQIFQKISAVVYHVLGVLSFERQPFLTMSNNLFSRFFIIVSLLIFWFIYDQWVEFSERL